MKRENAKEASLRTLMIAGLNGNTAAYRALLSGLSGHLRAYYRGKLVRAGRGAEEAEDLVQEAAYSRAHATPHVRSDPALDAVGICYRSLQTDRSFAAEPVNIDECTDRGCL